MNMYIPLKNDIRLFENGADLNDAQQYLLKKEIDTLSIEQKISMFTSTFQNDKKYKGFEFYDWHHNLTGSCDFGRQQFIKTHNLSLDDEFTVMDFIKLTENDYNGSIIKELKKYYI